MRVLEPCSEQVPPLILRAITSRRIDRSARLLSGAKPGCNIQLHTGEGQTRHMYLVLLAHTLLMAQLWQGRSSRWVHATLNTIGEACRAALRESLVRLSIGPSSVLLMMAGSLTVLRHPCSLDLT